MSHWIMKSEPDDFSIADLAKKKKEPWSGVRNYQARNFMRDQMRAGDGVLFYHSSCDEPGVYGVAKVVGKAYPDPTQFDPESPYYDPKSSKAQPRWFLVDVAFVKRLRAPLTLVEIKRHASHLRDCILLSPGNRLSVFPITKAHWDYLLRLAKETA